MANEIKIVVSAENKTGPGVTAAVADLAKIVAAAKEASAAIDGLDPTVAVHADTEHAREELHEVGEAAEQVAAEDPTVSVHADATGATAEIREVTDAAERIPAEETVTVRADTTEADQGLQEVAEREAEVEAADPTVTPRADTAEANAKLDATKRKSDEVTDPKVLKLRADITQLELTVAALKAKLEEATGDKRVKIEADIASAEARLAVLKARADDAAKGRSLKFDADTAGAVARIAMLVSAIAALVPVAVAASGALAGIGAVGAVGVGATIAGFTGIGKAVKAMGDNATAGGGAAASAAATIRGATRAVEAAQRDLKDSYDQVTEAAYGVQSAQRGVASAEQGVGDAAWNVAAAQRGVAAAERAVGDAAWNLAEAQRGVEVAEQGVADSEYTLTQSLASERRAEQDVTDARKAAARSLEDLQQQTEDMALSQEDAALAVGEAQARLNEVMADPRASALEKQRADLSVRQAQQREKDLSTSAKRLAEDKATADAKGVEGSDAVTAAQDRLTQAQHQVETAARAVESAQQGVAEANHRVEAATRGVEDAQQGVADAVHRQDQAQQALAAAQQHVADAQHAVAEADKTLAKAREGTVLATQRLADAQLALAEAHQKVGAASSGVNKLAQAMADLGPKGQAFVRFMRDFIDNDLKKLRQAGQEAFLPGIQSGLERLKPILAEIRPEFSAFSATLGKDLGDLIPIVGSLAEPFLRFANASLQGLQPLEGTLKTVSTDIGGVLDKLTSSGTATAAMRSLSDVLGAVLSILPPLIDSGGRLMQSMGPGLATTFQNLAQTIIDLLPGIEALAPSVSQILVAVSGILPPIAQLISHLLSLNPTVNTTVLSLGLAAVAVVKVATAINGLKDHISQVTGLFGGLRKSTDDVEGSTSRVATGLKAVGVALTAAQVASAAFGSSAASGVNTATKAMEEYAKTGKMSSDVTHDLGFDLSAMADTSLNSFGKFEKGTASMVESFTGLGSVFDSSIQHSTERIGSMDAALANLVSSGHADVAAAAFKRLGDEAQKQGLNVEDLRRAFPQYINALDKTSTSADGASGALNRMNQAQVAVNNTVLAAHDAEAGYYAAVDQATTAIQQNGATLNVHTEAGRANRQALDGLIQASGQYLQNLISTDAPAATYAAKQAEIRSQLVAVAQQSGLTKAEAQAYIDKLLQVPKTVTTNVQANTASAMADLQALHDRLMSLNGVLTVTPSTGTYGQGLGVYRAGGGWVGRTATPFGDGPKGSDTVPMWADPDEFVVRADVARANRGLLESLNSGRRLPAQRSTGAAPTGPGTAVPGGAVAAVQSTVVLEINSGGSQLDDLLVELLRRAVRTRGGNVQVALGQGAA